MSLPISQDELRWKAGMWPSARRPHITSDCLGINGLMCLKEYSWAVPSLSKTRLWVEVFSECTSALKWPDSSGQSVVRGCNSVTLCLLCFLLKDETISPTALLTIWAKCNGWDTWALQVHTENKQCSHCWRALWNTTHKATDNGVRIFCSGTLKY